MSAQPSSVKPARKVLGDASLAVKPKRLNLWLLFERKVLLNVATCMFMLAIAVMLYEGVLRATIGTSAFWAEESVRYLMVWAFFLTLGAAGNAGNHIRTEMLIERLPPALKRACLVLSSLVGVGFCSLLFYAALPQVKRYYTMGMVTESNLDLPLWLLFSVMPLGALLFLTYYLRCLIIALRGRDPFGNGEISGSQL